MENIKKCEIEKWLKEHHFSYKFHKNYLFIKKCGMGWRIPTWEFENASKFISLDIIFDIYTSKPGNSLRWWEGDTLYSFVPDR